MLVPAFQLLPEQESESEEEDGNSESLVCEIMHAVILGRSDKRKDRVEISPEMLIQVTFTFF